MAFFELVIHVDAKSVISVRIIKLSYHDFESNFRLQPAYIRNYAPLG